MSKTLKEKTAHAIIWSFIDKFGQHALSLVITIVLMRFFLSPSDYGLMGLIVVFNALGSILIDSGFSNALIRKQEVTQTELSSVFYFNIAVSLLFYCVLFFCAPFVASYYKQPILTSLIRVSSLGIPLFSLTLIQITLITKEVNFKLLAHTNLIAFISSGTISFFFAWKGLGVWVLVIQPLSLVCIKNICLWSVSSWRPCLTYSKQSVKNLWGYSSQLLASSTLTIVFNNLYTMLIGKYYPLNQVGYYSQANKHSELPYLAIMPAIQSVLYPVMAKMGDVNESLKKTLRKTIRVSSFVYFPVMFGIMATATPLVQTLFGAKWQPIVPYLQILCFGHIFLGMSSPFTNILYVKGKSAMLLKFNILYRFLQLLAFIFAIRFGIISMLVVWCMVGIIYTCLVALYSGNKIGYTFFEQLKDIAPYFIIALCMGVGIFFLSAFTENHVLLLFIQIAVGTAFYLSFTYLLGSKVFREVLEIIKNQIK